MAQKKGGEIIEFKVYNAVHRMEEYVVEMATMWQHLLL